MNQRRLLKLSPVPRNIYFHMIFDIKIGENYKCKARIVTGGHKTKASKFNYIQFGGISMFSAYMFTDCGTQ